MQAERSRHRTQQRKAKSTTGKPQATQQVQQQQIAAKHIVMGTFGGLSATAVAEEGGHPVMTSWHSGSLLDSNFSSLLDTGFSSRESEAGLLKSMSRRVGGGWLLQLAGECMIPFHSLCTEKAGKWVFRVCSDHYQALGCRKRAAAMRRFCI